MSVNPKSLHCWIVTEGMAGTEISVSESPKRWVWTRKFCEFKLRNPWKIMSPYLGFECAFTFRPELAAPWPDLLIASGRKSIAASRYIKRASGGKTFTVQVQDPRISPSKFDLVAVPEHDPTRGENVIVTAAAPNRVTDYKLAKSKTDFAPYFAMMPSPRIAVMLGGNSKAHVMSEHGMEKLGAQLSNINGSLMITASRRTTDGQKKSFLKGLGDHPHYFWDGTGENPYMGMLAWADAILVTADSVSMLSDAATTGKPVYMIPMEGGSPRFDLFHKNLLNRGALRPFEGIVEFWGYEPLRDSAIVAAEILRHLGKSP